jgi:hypothetical protein
MIKLDVARYQGSIEPVHPASASENENLHGVDLWGSSLDLSYVRTVIFA